MNDAEHYGRAGNPGWGPYDIADTAPDIPVIQAPLSPGYMVMPVVDRRPRKSYTGMVTAASLVVLVLVLGSLVTYYVSTHSPVQVAANAGASGPVSTPVTAPPSTTAPPVTQGPPSQAPVVSPPTTDVDTGGEGEAAAGVVEQYYSDINNGDYQDAWDLGGDNLEGGSYDDYVNGFSTTAEDTLNVEGVQPGSDDWVVDFTLDAQQTDGTTKEFEGYYTVADGVITGGHVVETS